VESAINALFCIVLYCISVCQLTRSTQRNVGLRVKLDFVKQNVICNEFSVLKPLVDVDGSNNESLTDWLIVGHIAMSCSDVGNI